MKATRIRFVANAYSELTGVWKFKFQLRRGAAEVGFLVKTNLATDMTINTAYIEKNIETINTEKGT